MSEELEKLKSELHYRKTIKRIEIGKELRRAEELGDLFRENFPYDAAVADQRHNETRIINIENAINSLSERKEISNLVQIGSEVELEKEDGSIMHVRLVDEDVFRARIYPNAITLDSPLGKLLVGKHKGIEVTLSTSNRKYRILNIT